MPKLPVIRIKQLVRILLKLGYSLHHQVGSHAQYKNNYGKRITVPVHNNKEVNRKTLKGIIDDLDLSVDEFLKLLK